MRAVAVELEIRRPGIERDLPRGDRQWPDRYAGDRHVDEIADLLNRADLYLGGKDAPYRLGRHIGLNDQDKAPRPQDRAVHDRTDPHTIAALLQRDRGRRLLQYRRQ